MLELDFWTIVWTIVNLLVLYFFFKKFLFGRVNAVLDKRAEQIGQDLEAAEARKQEAEALKAQYDEKLQGAQQEAAQILTDAKTRGEQAYSQRMAQAQEETAAMRRDAEDQIARQKEKMLQGARKEVGRLAVLAAAKITQQTLNEQTEQAMAEALLKEAGEQA